MSKREIKANVENTFYGEQKPGIYLTRRVHPGNCKICGAPFTGPKNKKYCDDHSPRIHLTGRG